uniref:Uncharacterized protein n=1 Tax=Candidatus Kentrum sp. LPFa TaxID=2126335 RepID=A0A450VZJ5_9GAMM|nr:MAG: hypothetical protein BECKLPF1236B_GA0070989_101310 [Candidatus Kentron sp. LPFa]
MNSSQSKKQRLKELQQRFENLENVGSGQAILFQERCRQRLQRIQGLSRQLFVRDKEIAVLEQEIREMENTGKEIDGLSRLATNARERLSGINTRLNECIDLTGRISVFAENDGNGDILGHLHKLQDCMGHIDAKLESLLVETINQHHVINEHFDLEQKENWISGIEVPINVFVIACKQTNAFGGRQSGKELARYLIGAVGHLATLLSENPGRTLTDRDREFLQGWSRELNDQLKLLGNTSEPKVIQGSEALVDELLMWQRCLELKHLKADIQHAVTEITQTKANWKSREEQEIEQAIRQGKMIFKLAQDEATRHRAGKLEKLSENLALLREGGITLAEIEALAGDLSRNNEAIGDLQGHEDALRRISELDQRCRESSHANLPTLQDKLHEHIQYIEKLISKVDVNALSAHDKGFFAGIRTKLAEMQPDSGKGIDYHLDALRKINDWRGELQRLLDEIKAWQEQRQIRLDNLNDRQTNLEKAIAESGLVFPGPEESAWSGNWGGPITADTRESIDTELNERETRADQREGVFAELCYRELSDTHDRISMIGSALATAKSTPIADLPALPPRQDIGLDVLVAALAEARRHLGTAQARLEQESQDNERWCRETAPRILDGLTTTGIKQVDREAVRQLKDELTHLPEGLTPEEYFRRLSGLKERWQTLIDRIQGADHSLEEQRRKLFQRLSALHENGLTDYCPPFWVGRASDLIQGLPETATALRPFQKQITASKDLLDNLERHFLCGAATEIQVAASVLRRQRSQEAIALLSELADQPTDRMPSLELRQRLRQAASLRGCAYDR